MTRIGSAVAEPIAFVESDDPSKTAASAAEESVRPTIPGWDDRSRAAVIPPRVNPWFALSH